MRTSRQRGLTWALVAVGVAIVALGGVLAAMFPWGQVAAPWGAAGPGTWHGFYGHPHAWGFFHGPGSSAEGCWASSSRSC